MKIHTVWAIWFSATGTTERVVLTLADALAKKLGAGRRDHCFALPAARETELALGSGELAVVGTPVYAGRVPNLLVPYLRDRLKGPGALAVPVVLFGNRDFDDALIELRELLRGNGFLPVSAGAFVGEHAFSRTLGVGRPDGEDLALAGRLAEGTAEKLLKSDGAGPAPVEVPGCLPLRPYYTPRDRKGTPINILKVKPKTVPERCTQCGLCAALCPMGAISAEDVTQVPGVCIKCCACVKKCPAGAKYYDDAGYLYHQHELEEIYRRRADSQIFL